MIGAIAIKNLQFSAVLGVNPEERIKEQRLTLSIEIGCDFAPCRGSTDTKSTVDWATTAAQAKQFIRDGRFHLVETAVLELAELLLGHPLARSVKVELGKLEADVGAAELSARIELAKNA